MDRSKWEYKKLGEVATFERGLTYSKGDEATFSSKGVLRSNNIDLDTHQLVFDEIKYLNPNFVIPESKKLKKDSIFICMSNGSKAHLGKVAFADKDYDYAFGGFMGMIVPKDIYPRYLFYYFLSHNYRNGLEQVGKGANINNLRFAQLAEFMVPTPFISDQQRIVAELDCLNEMIAVKQEQLKEFDKLAQSIFYDMFGDIESNSKGFDKSHLGKICQLKAGKAIKAEELHEDSEGLYPCFGGNGIRGFIDRFSHEGLFPIIGRQGALCGNINIAKGKFYATEHAVVVTPSIEMNRTWLAFVLQSMHLEKYAHGVAQPGLSVKDLNPLDMITPPLALQQQFAEKISAIEAQKELVKQSIAETQALLDYTMDKYFGYD